MAQNKLQISMAQSRVISKSMIISKLVGSQGPIHTSMVKRKDLRNFHLIRKYYYGIFHT